jgi:hypothetical protein
MAKRLGDRSRSVYADASMARRLFWVALMIAAAAGVVANIALNTILLGCDYTTMGLGRPLCESDVASAYRVLTVALAVVVLSGVSAVVLHKRRNRRPS